MPCASLWDYMVIKANREMDERLLIQLERIEELKKELSKSRERENVLKEKFKLTPDVEHEMQRLTKVVAEMQVSSRMQLSHVQVI